jgi:hypothetical protein
MAVGLHQENGVGFTAVEMIFQIGRRQGPVLGNLSMFLLFPVGPLAGKSGGTFFQSDRIDRGGATNAETANEDRASSC